MVPTTSSSRPRKSSTSPGTVIFEFWKTSLIRVPAATRQSRILSWRSLFSMPGKQFVVGVIVAVDELVAVALLVTFGIDV
jgi:hypothetical protein